MVSSVMKVLVVCSYNSGQINSFIKEQVESLRKTRVEIDYYKIVGKGIFGYLKNLIPLRERIKKGNYDLIHAHYGLSGFLANLQRTVPVITTYHGSDIHYKFNRVLSLLASRLSKFNILTNKRQINQLRLRKGFQVIPCGVNTAIFYPMDKISCRKKLGLSLEERIILFCSTFDREVKNATLAKEAINKLDNARLLELKGYSREEVSLVINSADAVLITSFYETGPLVAKEALACNTPIVSTDVGDVKDLIDGLPNCYIVAYDADDVAKKLYKVLNRSNNYSYKGIENLSLQNIATKIKNIYEEKN